MTTTKKKKPAPETVLERLERIAIDTLDRAEAEPDTALRVTAVRAAALVIGELRKAEKATRDAESALTTAHVLEWVRRMPTAERAQFMRTIANLSADTGRSGLA